MHGTVGIEIRFSSGGAKVRTGFETGVESLRFYFDNSVFRIVGATRRKTGLISEYVLGFVRESTELSDKIRDNLPEAEAVREALLEQQREDRSPICT